VTQPCDILAYDRNGHELMKGDVVRVNPEGRLGTLVSAIEGRCHVVPAEAGGIAIECGAESLEFVSR
jgi:hypothetical protein